MVRDEGTHRDIVDRAEQQVSVGVTVDLGLSLKHHSLIVQWLDNLWLLLRGEDRQEYKRLSFQINKLDLFDHMFSLFCLDCGSGKVHTPPLVESS